MSSRDREKVEPRSSRQLDDEDVVHHGRQRWRAGAGPGMASSVSLLAVALVVSACSSSGTASTQCATSGSGRTTAKPRTTSTTTNGGAGAGSTSLASFNLTGRTCAEIATAAQISAIVGVAVSQDPDVASSGHVNDGPRSDGWGCTFSTQGNESDDLLVDISVSRSEMQFYTAGLQLGPMAGLGSMAEVQTGQYGPTMDVLAKNALLRVSDSGGPLTAQQLEAIAQKIYATLAN